MFTFQTVLSSIVHLMHCFTITLVKKMDCIVASIIVGILVLCIMFFTSTAFSGDGKHIITPEPMKESFEQVQWKEDIVQNATLLTDSPMDLQVARVKLIHDAQLCVGESIEKHMELAKEVRIEKQQIIQSNKEMIHELEVKKQSTALQIGYTQEDYEVLKRIVQAESGGCDIHGRILTANVILNRVRSSEFPNDITSVVFQEQQFSPISDGAFFEVEVTEATIEAVDRALAGEDYSQGAMYFMNRELSHEKHIKWFDNRLTYLFEHDQHEYFK